MNRLAAPLLLLAGFLLGALWAQAHAEADAARGDADAVRALLEQALRFRAMREGWRRPAG